MVRINMGDSTFRTATPTKNPAVEAKIVEKTPDRVSDIKTDVPIAFYKEMNDKPYSAGFFEVTQYHDMNESLKADLDMIDDAYKSRVAKGTYEDGPDTFKEMIKEAEKVTDTKLSNTNIKVAKVAEYLRFMERLKKVDIESDRWK